MVSGPALLAFFLFWGVQGDLHPFTAERAVFIRHAEYRTQENYFLARLLTDPAASKLPLILLTGIIFGENFPRPLSGLLMVMQGRFSALQ